MFPSKKHTCAKNGVYLRQEVWGPAPRGRYIPVHLGASRLRTDTAAVLAAAAVYLKY